MDLFLDVLLDAVVDTLKLAPLLFIIYVIIEFVEIRFGNRLGSAMAKAGKAGPAIGAVTGIIPQCGISVVGTALYTQRLITIGTLFAVYITTSDEAIPIILSNPEAISTLGPILLTKLVIAILVGYLLDLAFRKRNKLVFAHDEHYAEGTDDASHHHETAFEEKGCCGHEPASEEQKLTPRTLLLHPLIHTLKVLGFIFAVTFILGLGFAYIGQDNIANFLADHLALQPILAGLIGLIPNCAASVAVTEFYLEGVITFGAAIAGLCASGGLGILVLVREDSHKEAAAIIAGLFVIAVVCGLIIQAVGITV